MGEVRRHFQLLTSNEAEACLELWASRKFDTNDISRLLGVHESAVARTVQAARDMAIILRREGKHE